MGRILALMLVTALLAGCAGTDPDPAPGPTTTAPPLGQAFDGAGAYDLTEGLVTYDDGTPRYRVPGTPGHGDGAQWLQQQMALPGWDVVRQSFTGSEYQELEKPTELSSYAQPGAHCHPRDQQRLPDLTFHNLMATHDVPDEERHVLLAAHWDSKENTSDGAQEAVLGANDGASGVGLLLQLMRHVADGSLVVPFDLKVVFFDGEDGFEDCHPLAGSVHYAETMEDAPARMLLLDMVGDPEARFVREGNSVRVDPGFVDLLWEHGHALGLAENMPDVSRAVLDDHIPFVAKGIRAVDLIDYGREDGRGGFPPYWHTTGDTMENIDADMLGRVGATVAAALQDERFLETL